MFDTLTPLPIRPRMDIRSRAVQTRRTSSPKGTPQMAKTDTSEKQTRERRNVAVDGMDLDTAKKHASKIAQDAATCAVMKGSKEYESAAKAAKALHDALSKCA